MERSSSLSPVNGLVRAITVVENDIYVGGAKTLLLEKHNIPGGCATSFVRGQFEFEVALHQPPPSLMARLLPKLLPLLI